jgi:hypothetical protein
MNPEAEAEVTLLSGTDIPASPVPSFGVIVSFGVEAFSAAVVPAGSMHLRSGATERVRLRFLVPAASPYLRPGTEFTFSEGGRSGSGRIV